MYIEKRKKQKRKGFNVIAKKTVDIFGGIEYYSKAIGKPSAFISRGRAVW